MKFINALALFIILFQITTPLNKEFQFDCYEDCLEKFKNFLSNQNYISSEETIIDILYQDGGYVGVCSEHIGRPWRCIIHYYYGKRKEVKFIKSLQPKSAKRLILLFYSKMNPSIEFIDSIALLKSTKCDVHFLYSNQRPIKQQNFNTIEYLFQRNKITGDFFFKNSVVKKDDSIVSLVNRLGVIVNKIIKAQNIDNKKAGLNKVIQKNEKIKVPINKIEKSQDENISEKRSDNREQLNTFFIEGKKIKELLLSRISKFNDDLLKKEKKQQLNNYLLELSNKNILSKKVRRITVNYEQITLPPKVFELPKHINDILYNIIEKNE